MLNEEQIKVRILTHYSIFFAKIKFPGNQTFIVEENTGLPTKNETVKTT